MVSFFLIGLQVMTIFANMVCGLDESNHIDIFNLYDYLLLPSEQKCSQGRRTKKKIWWGIEQI